LELARGTDGDTVADTTAEAGTVAAAIVIMVVADTDVDITGAVDIMAGRELVTVLPTTAVELAALPEAEVTVDSEAAAFMEAVVDSKEAAAFMEAVVDSTEAAAFTGAVEDRMVAADMVAAIGN
jgi:hypothetical protein